MKHTLVYLLTGLALLALTSCGSTKAPDAIDQACARMLDNALNGAK